MYVHCLICGRVLPALRLLDDADLQRIGISTLGPRRKILGLLAQQRKRGEGGPSTGALRPHMNPTADSPVRLTPPMLESQLAKRHCVKASPAAELVGAGIDAGATQACALSGAEPGNGSESRSEEQEQEQSSLWELASRHDAKPFEYRTVLLPDQGHDVQECAQANQGQRNEIGASAVHGQAAQSIATSMGSAVDVADDESGLAALDELLQQSSPPPPPRRAVAANEIDSPEALHASPSRSNAPSAVVAGSTGAEDAAEMMQPAAGPNNADCNDYIDHSDASDRADIAGIYIEEANSNPALAGARGGARIDDDATTTTASTAGCEWDMTDVMLATVLELPAQFRMALDHAATTVVPAGLEDEPQPAPRAKIKALHETYLERLRALRREFGRDAEKILQIGGTDARQQASADNLSQSAVVQQLTVTSVDARAQILSPAGESESDNLYASAIVLDDSDDDDDDDDDDDNNHSSSVSRATAAAELLSHPTQIEDQDADADADAGSMPIDGTPISTGATTAVTMPNFGAMDLAELKRRVKQFGLKASGKKVMVRQLTEIWTAQNQSEPQPSALTSDARSTRPDVTSSSDNADPGATGAAATAAATGVSMGVSVQSQPQSNSQSTNVSQQVQLSRDQTLSRQVRAFVLSQPQWYTTVLLLNAIDMRALNAAMKHAASLDSNMLKCSLKQLEAILREQGISFQSQSQSSGGGSGGGS